MSVCQGCATELPPPKRASGRRQKWCSEACRKRTLYSTPCVDCGAATSGDGAYHERCGRCSGWRAGEGTRQRFMAQRTMIEAMWADGYTARQIADAVGWNTSHPGAFISGCRSRGYDLPHRRSPEQVARIIEASTGNLEKARRARKATAA